MTFSTEVDVKNWRTTISDCSLPTSNAWLSLLMGASDFISFLTESASLLEKVRLKATAVVTAKALAIEAARVPVEQPRGEGPMHWFAVHGLGKIVLV